MLQYLRIKHNNNILLISRILQLTNESNADECSAHSIIVCSNDGSSEENLCHLSRSVSKVRKNKRKKKKTESNLNVDLEEYKAALRRR